MRLIAEPNSTKTGFRIPSEYGKAVLTDWLRKYRRFAIIPITVETRKGRRYLHGAVEPAYCKWQYDIDPRDPGMGQARHFLFMRDFHHEIVNNRDGNPERIPVSSRGEAMAVLDRYTEWAKKNGAPIPNPELFKLYRDQYSMDPRWMCFHDWLDFLGIEEDAFPSSEAFEKLHY